MERYEIGSNTIIDDKTSIESQYQKMEIDREIYLERARDSAELTIPYLVPEKGSLSVLCLYVYNAICCLFFLVSRAQMDLLKMILVRKSHLLF